MLCRTGALTKVGETSEELMLVAWAVWQTLRIILIVKKQKQAQQSAKTLINFDNVILDTDFASVSFRDERYAHGRHSDPNIFDSDFKEHPDVKEKKKKKTVVSAVTGAFKRPKTKEENVIEMKDFNNIDHYVIDDEDLPEPKTKPEA